MSFGDLTLLVGPQATGKSLILQLLKLGVDGNRIAGVLDRHGFGWKNRGEFCAVYFGEGMAGAWTDETSVMFRGRRVTAPPARKSLRIQFTSISPDAPRLVQGGVEFPRRRLD